jgi:hypothetical protein
VRADGGDAGDSPANAPLQKLPARSAKLEIMMRAPRVATTQA